MRQLALKGVEGGDRKRGTLGGETRRERNSLRIGVHHADAVVWGPVYGTHLGLRDVGQRVDEVDGAPPVLRDERALDREAGVVERPRWSERREPRRDLVRGETRRVPAEERARGRGGDRAILSSQIGC